MFCFMSHTFWDCFILLGFDFILFDGFFILLGFDFILNYLISYLLMFSHSTEIAISFPLRQVSRPEKIYSYPNWTIHSPGWKFTLKLTYSWSRRHKWNTHPPGNQDLVPYFSNSSASLSTSLVDLTNTSLVRLPPTTHGSSSHQPPTSWPLLIPPCTNLQFANVALGCQIKD